MNIKDNKNGLLESVLTDFQQPICIYLAIF